MGSSESSLKKKEKNDMEEELTAVQVPAKKERVTKDSVEEVEMLPEIDSVDVSREESAGQESFAEELPPLHLSVFVCVRGGGRMGGIVSRRVGGWVDG